MDLPLDRYTIGARLAPVWIVFLPVAFVAGVFLGKDSIEAGLAVWLGTAVALTALFAQLGRAGRKLEPKLFARWGGAPTTVYLRYVGSPLNPNTRDRVVRKLAAMIPGIRWPTPEDEAADRAAADQVYESAALYVRERTRDPERFRLVFAENVSYGFRRNLWAMKPTGVFLAAGGIVVLAVKIAIGSAPGSTVRAAPSTWVALAGCTLLFVLWMLRIREPWVREAANAYTERLLGAVEEL